VEELGLGLDLIIVLVAAIAGGILAHWLRLPIILGYLATGIAVGPYGLGLVRDLETINALATIGVILLLFTLGLEFSLNELKRIGRIAVWGGSAQILLTAGVGFALGKLLGWETTSAIFFGFLIALSSTMIVLKTLMERGELDSAHGRVMIGILLVQDLSLVPLMIILPAMGGEEGVQLWSSLGIATLKATLFIGVMLVLGIWGLPWLLERVAGRRSRELFLLTVVTLSLGAAFGAQFLGLSAAVGAFIAGLLIGQSVFARQAVADIVPLRDIFGALFFVSLGMLVDLNFAADNPAIIALVVVAIIAAKFIICAMIPRVFGYSPKTTLFTGMGLIQIGEFSFVLAAVGLEVGIISQNIYSITLAAAIITMGLTPFALNFASTLYRWLSQGEKSGWLIASHLDPGWLSKQQLAGHAVICGHGRVGNTLTKVLEQRNLPYLVIDIDPQVISRLRSQRIPCIYGDASNSEILAHTELNEANLLICTFPNFMDVELTVRNALKINPKLDIVARVHRDIDAELIKGIGVSELVRPEFEASLEITRHTLHRFGLTTVEIQHILNNLREGRLL
jgi:CPA2 family monovalent cation:H+ antiporter-2